MNASEYIKEISELVASIKKNGNVNIFISQLNNKLGELGLFQLTKEDWANLDNLTDKVPENIIAPEPKASIALMLNNREKSLKYFKLSLRKVVDEIEFDEPNIFFTNLFYLTSYFPTFHIEAIQEIKDLIEKDKYPLIHEMLIAYQLLFENKIEEAIDHFLYINQITNENCFYADIELANIYFSQNIFENACFFYKQSVEKIKNFEHREYLTFYNLSWVLFKIGLLNLKLNDYVGAEKYYRLTLSESPELKGVKNNLAYSLLKQNKVGEAIEIFDDCIKNKIDGEAPYWNKIRCLKKLKKFEDAILIATQLHHKSKKKTSIDNEIKSLEKLMKNKKNNKADDQLENVENEKQFIIDDQFVKSKLAEASSIGSERLLEDLFIRKIQNKEKVFDRNLVIDFLGRPTRQYVIRGKRIDILALDTDTNELVIIELKKVKSSEEVFEQISNYMDWVKKDVAKNREVAGIICVPEMTDKLIAKAKSRPKLEIHTFSLLTTRVAY